ncbi:glycoside hydrolase family 172 protein [Prevotella sp. 10(H)]|uniref:glycoside hydrolase family 172 protein n=1 Tax=Prevotella sp. 10(H) TaxID=1158294 RepID=UPI0004A7766F|nr:glycoside hydrolase family 172 protein [Prevotella sp. 10(H)]
MKRLIFILFCILFFIPLYPQKKGSKEQTAPPITLVNELEQLYNPSLLPQYREGIMEQESSYDRTGNNDDGFSGKYSYIRKEGDKLVLADYKGPGVINRIWTPTPTTDTIRFYIDGEKVPRISIPFIDLFSGKTFPFVNPVCGNEVGGYYCYVPIQFAKSCKIVFCGEKIMFHQIQYRPYPQNTKVEPFNMAWTEAQKEVLDKACNFWNRQVKPLTCLDKSGLLTETKQFFLAPGEVLPLFTTNEGGRIAGIELDFGAALEGTNKDIILKAQWDDDESPAIYSPAADFFGYAYGKPAMQSLLLGSYQGTNYCYIPMPYQKKADMSLIYEKRQGGNQSKVEVKAKVYYTKEVQNPGKEGRLYTIWRREINPKDFEPYLFADVKDRGHYVGITHIAQGLRPGMTLFFEGDDSTVVDNKLRMHGTGSEDYYNGGWYALLDRWDRGVSLPIHGSLDYSLPMARTGAYRFFLTDKVVFENNLLVTIEHGPEQNRFPVDYTSVAFYYGSKPADCSVQPTEKLRTVYYPSTHIYFPQLMNLSIGHGLKLENRERLIAETENEGMVRIMLDEVPEGVYRIKLTYYKTPDGGAFEVWNRQKPIKSWEDAYSEQEVRIENADLGTFTLTRHTNSISIKVKKTEKGSKFHFDILTLEKQ